jgi:inosine/xanthosine triphosphate pyrophosphatase family protein
VASESHFKAELTLSIFSGTVFVTGNANKLKEVQAILAAGTSGISVTNQAVDCKQIANARVLKTLIQNKH